MNYNYLPTADSQADYRNRRSKDVQDEKIVGDYLDAYFYPTFTTSTTRNTDKALQIAGLDISATHPNGYKFTIDEKAATHWAGRNLQTFAHEINSINVAGQLYDGWLLDFHSASEWLVEVWIDGINSTDGKLHDYTNITDATIVLVYKQDLYDYLRKKNVSSNSLKEVASNLRMMNKPSEYYNGFKITHQMNYQEHACNILIPRDTLINTISRYAVQIKNGQITIFKK